MWRFLRLTKDFRQCWSQHLIDKTRALRFQRFRSYFFYRKQYVSVENVASKPMPINCGVPQRSVLGPLFFLLYINDLQKCLRYGRSFIFADDTALLVSHTTPEALRKETEYWLKTFTSLAMAISNILVWIFLKQKPFYLDIDYLDIQRKRWTMT